MRIETSSSALTNLRNAPRVTTGGPVTSSEAEKTIGEAPPVPANEAEVGTLASLFQAGGMITKILKRLNRLKNRKARAIPAKGTIACIDSDELIYVGIGFLQEFKDREDVIAGVLAHEVGHACAVKPHPDEIKKMNWDEIFSLRREHETLADELAGRLLALMGYKPDGIIEFLGRNECKTHNLKYHDPQIRQQIILNGYDDEKRKIKLANELFPKRTYSNHYNTRFLDEG